MIKFKASGMLPFPGEEERLPLLGLGLSHENVRNLRAGKPILVRGHQIDVDFDVVIFYGITEQDMADQLKEWIGPDTKINLEPM